MNADTPQPRLRVVPCTIGDARRFVGAHHRHCRPPVSGLFAVGVTAGDEADLVAVAIAARPMARGLQDGSTIEVTRVCTVGHRNAASKLYGAVCRAARALGYQRAVTYTLDGEPGTSLRASGWICDGVVRARSWNTSARPRHEVDLFGAPMMPPRAACDGSGC